MIKKKDRERIKSNIAKLFREKPEARLVENRYRSMRVILEIEYPLLFEVLEQSRVPKETVLKFLKDGTYVDRAIRLFSEGSEKEKKTLLSQEFINEEII